jgi:hypothetical protein
VLASAGAVGHLPPDQSGLRITIQTRPGTRRPERLRPHLPQSSRTPQQASSAQSDKFFRMHTEWTPPSAMGSGNQARIAFRRVRQVPLFTILRRRSNPSGNRARNPAPTAKRRGRTAQFALELFSSSRYRAARAGPGNGLARPGCGHWPRTRPRTSQGTGNRICANATGCALSGWWRWD